MKKERKKYFIAVCDIVGWDEVLQASNPNLLLYWKDCQVVEKSNFIQVIKNNISQPTFSQVTRSREIRAHRVWNVWNTQLKVKTLSNKYSKVWHITLWWVWQFKFSILCEVVFCVIPFCKDRVVLYRICCWNI